MDESNLQANEAQDVFGVYARPDYQLVSLPVPTRWEVTRRHPTYVQFWQLAECRYRDGVSFSPSDQACVDAAVGCLKLIGVMTKPCSPAKEFNEIDDEALLNAWRAGAVHPLTIRTLASLMIESLSKETLKVVMMALYYATKEDAPEEPAAFEGLALLESAELEELDKFFAAPYVAINPTASITQVHDDITHLLKGWKSEREIGDRRDRSDKHSEYFKVWDLREGWRGGKYEPLEAMRFEEIAKQLKRPIATINNQYRRAFELITGHAYAPERWATLMGPIRMPALHAALNADVLDERASWRRPMKSPKRSPVPESRLIAPGAESGSSSFSSAVSATDELHYRGLISEVMGLINKGASKERVAEEMGVLAAELPDLGVLYDQLAELSA